MTDTNDKSYICLHISKQKRAYINWIKSIVNNGTFPGVLHVHWDAPPDPVRKIRHEEGSTGSFVDCPKEGMLHIIDSIARFYLQEE